MDRLTYYLDNRGPMIVRRISTAASTFDVTAGQNFRLKVRDRWGATPLINALMVPDTVADTVSYQPIASDFSAEGLFRAWIEVDFGNGIKQDTDEFEIAVLAHSPGDAVQVGAVYRAARAMAPIAWDALHGYRDYGDPELQRQIDLTKLRVMRRVVSVGEEATMDPRVIDYIARKTLVDSVLDAAINFWTNQLVSQSARSSTGEVQQFPDRIKAHVDLLARLADRLLAQRLELEEILGVATGPAAMAPALLGGGRPLTPGLELMPPSYRDPRRLDGGWWWW